MLERLAHLIVRRRRLVIGVWIVLTVFGAFSAQQVSKRWLTQFSIPGYSAYETNQRTLHVFGSGEQAPMVAVFHSAGDVTKQTGISKAVESAHAANKGSRVSSYFTTGSRAYVSKDGHTTFATIYPAGIPDFTAVDFIKPTRAALKAAVPAGVTVNLTGLAQVRHGYETSMAEKLSHDLEWIADRSVPLYLRTLFATGWRVLRQTFRR